MLDLKQLKPKVTHDPPRLVFYGPPGKGKTYTAAQAGEHIFLNINDGLGGIPHTAFPIRGADKGDDIFKTYDEIIWALDAILNQDHDFRVLIIDGLSDLEELIHRQICAASGVSTIAKACGGYGKGYVEAMNSWNEVLSLLSQIRQKRNMVIVLLAHSNIKSYADPMADSYDRHVLKLHDAAAFRIREWADAVLFLDQKVYIDKSQEGMKKIAKANSLGLTFFTSENPRHQAKNRYGLPSEIPMSWQGLMAAMSEAATKANTVTASERENTHNGTI